MPPSLLHPLPTLCLATLFCSGDHSPTSDAVALASCCVTGLYDMHWMASLCVYFRIPSACSRYEENAMLGLKKFISTF